MTDRLKQFTQDDACSVQILSQVSHFILNTQQKKAEYQKILGCQPNLYRLQVFSCFSGVEIKDSVKLYTPMCILLLRHRQMQSLASQRHSRLALTHAGSTWGWGHTGQR